MHKNKSFHAYNHATILAMANFFDIKARKAAAAEASSSKAPVKQQEPNRAQPWVEK
jgi:hypothetical protein